MTANMERKQDVSLSALEYIEQMPLSHGICNFSSSSKMSEYPWDESKVHFQDPVKNNSESRANLISL